MKRFNPAMTRPVITLMLMLSLMLAGCAGVGPWLGSQPAPGEQLGVKSSSQLPAELGNANCDKLAKTLQAALEKMRAAKARAKTEDEAPPTTLARTVARAMGPPGSGNSAFEEYASTRRDADAINRRLEEKGCGTVDIDKLLDPLGSPPTAPRTTAML
jgi:hypothetical protein